jgi:hypothetical protein
MVYGTRCPNESSLNGFVSYMLEQPVAIWPLNERGIVRSITVQGNLYQKHKDKINCQKLPKGFPHSTNPSDRWLRRFAVETQEALGIAVQIRPLLRMERSDQGEYTPMYVGV